MRFSVTAGRSDVGRQRDHNEDAILVRRDLVAVADGMGGHAAGEVASALAIAVLEERADELLAIASRGTTDNAGRHVGHDILVNAIPTGNFTNVSLKS